MAMLVLYRMLKGSYIDTMATEQCADSNNGDTDARICPMITALIVGLFSLDALLL